MAETADRKDYFRPKDWRSQYPDNGNRFIYFTYKLTLTSQYWRNNPPYTDIDTTTRSYYMTAPMNSILINKGYRLYEVVGTGADEREVLRAEGTLVDISNFPNVRRGYIVEAPDNAQLFTSDHKIKTLTITDAGFAQYCSSTSADGRTDRALHTATRFQSGAITFVSGDSGFVTELNNDGSLKKIKGTCKNIYKDFDWTEWGDKDFDKNYSLFYHTPDATDPEHKPNPYQIWNYELIVEFYNNYEQQEDGRTVIYDCPQLYEVTIPSDNAWIHDDDGLLTLSNKLPKQLEWARPYPYGKWYRDSNGELRTRGLPETLVDTQGAFNECPNLIYVKIPESVKSIGRYAFRDTNLKSVKIASDCTYYPTSVPIGCKIYFYGGGSPVMTDIRSLEGYTIGELETKTINEMEGN